MTVSYTHLDVYKRQFHSGVGAAVLAALPCVGWSVHVGQKRDFINPQGVDDDMHTVSYTHLDVYKRQVSACLVKHIHEVGIFKDIFHLAAAQKVVG